MQISKLNMLVVMSVPFFIVSCSMPVSFKKDVKPILVANCLSCHDGSGEGSSASGFNVQTYESVMKGTKYGPVIEPGNSESSTLYRMVAHKVDPEIQMPPHHEEASAKGREDELTPRQIEFIEKWIDEGAKNN
jgi:hypothetical protein